MTTLVSLNISKMNKTLRSRQNMNLWDTLEPDLQDYVKSFIKPFIKFELGKYRYRDWKYGDTIEITKISKCYIFYKHCWLYNQYAQKYEHNDTKKSLIKNEDCEKDEWTSAHYCEYIGNYSKNDVFYADELKIIPS